MFLHTLEVEQENPDVFPGEHFLLCLTWSCRVGGNSPSFAENICLALTVSKHVFPAVMHVEPRAGSEIVNYGN